MYEGSVWQGFVVRGYRSGFCQKGGVMEGDFIILIIQLRFDW